MKITQNLIYDHQIRMSASSVGISAVFSVFSIWKNLQTMQNNIGDAVGTDKNFLQNLISAYLN